ncbi:MAG: YHS domain-containing protein [Actinomycetota bacterium]|nr:YHS domain-containing protein [Actinomycetota bacterium]
MDHHTFLFADLAGFTALTEAMGDQEAADLVGRFGSAVEERLPDYRAEAIKSIGDALMIRSDQAADAVSLGLDIVHEIGGQHFFPTVRVGMDTGTATARGDDWFGATVNLAARVSGIAAGGEVLLTEATRVAAGAVEGVEIRQHGRHELKNVGEPVLLHAAVREGQRSQTGLPIDPVCRMAVDPEHCAGSLSHEGREFHFCSLECAARFASSPDRYKGETGSHR